MSKKRIACAIIAGLLSVLLAHTHSFATPVDTSEADAEDCNTASYYNFVDMRDGPDLSDDIAGQLNLSTSYLEACPTRPEKARIALRAARIALDAGQPDTALQLFETARLHGATFHAQARMDYITALMIDGDADRARDLRDKEIAKWLDQLMDTGFADIDTMRLRDGLVHKITFNAVDPSYREVLAWFAVPFGDGFPTTISLSSDSTLIELLKLREPARASGLQQLRLNRCHGRDTLMSNITGIDEAEANTRALAAAKAYLAKPDGVSNRHKNGQPVASCFNLDRLFILPDPAIAVPAY